MPLVIRTILRFRAAITALALAAAVITAGGGTAAAETDYFDLDVGERVVQVKISYPAGEKAWGQWARARISSGIPALEEATGHPYSGPDKISVRQRSDEQLHGYAGTASCRVTYCHLNLLPDYDELTLLHELAHLWTQPFGKRWLAEGYAEFASLRAANALGFGAKPFDEFDGPPFFPISEWGEPVYLSSVPEAAAIIEYAGYEYSYELFALLEQRVGDEALTAANSKLFTEQPKYSVGSRLYMDTLEETSGAKLDDAFAQWVFPPDAAVLLAQRRDARDRLAAIEAKAEELELTVNATIGERIADWRFDEALTIIERNETNLESYDEMKAGLDAIAREIQSAGLPYPRTFEEVSTTWDFADVLASLPKAQEALEAYTEAAAVVGEERGFLQRIGLLGRQPNGALADAASHFGGSRFHESQQASEAAIGMIEDAEGAAGERLVFVAGLVIVLAAAALIVRRYARDQALPDSDRV